VRLAVLPSVWEAELLCNELREAGIRCFHRVTDVGFAASEIASTAGPREVLVRAVDRERALKIAERM
jgi:hypothetical protein